MNNDILKGNWKQIKGNVKKAWGKLTDDEVDQIDGDMDNFVGRVQEKYGYSKEDARSKVNDFLKDFKDENSH